MVRTHGIMNSTHTNANHIVDRIPDVQGSTASPEVSSVCRRIMGQIDALYRNPRTKEFYIKRFIERAISLNPNLDQSLRLEVDRMLEQNPHLQPTFLEEIKETTALAMITPLMLGIKGVCCLGRITGIMANFSLISI